MQVSLLLVVVQCVSNAHRLDGLDSWHYIPHLPAEQQARGMRLGSQDANLNEEIKYDLTIFSFYTYLMKLDNALIDIGPTSWTS